MTVLLAATTLAGCADNAAQPAASNFTLPDSAGPALFDATTGAVEGTVTDDELQVLPAAHLQLREIENVTDAAADGSFAFSHVAPGTYHLDAQKLGYDLATHVVTVAEGQSVKVHVQLTAIPLVVPHKQTYIWRGHVTCSVGQSLAGYSEECGAGVGVPGMGRVGGNPDNKVQLDWNLTQQDDLENLKTILVELDWTPASPAAREMSLHVAHNFVCDPNCHAQRVYCNVTSNHGPPIVRCVVKGEKIGILNANDVPWKMTAFVWAAPSDTGTVLLEQDFTIYRTYFWGDPMPDDFSAAQDD